MSQTHMCMYTDVYVYMSAHTYIGDILKQIVNSKWCECEELSCKNPYFTCLLNHMIYTG